VLSSSGNRLDRFGVNPVLAEDWLRGVVNGLAQKSNQFMPRDFTSHRGSFVGLSADGDCFYWEFFRFFPHNVLTLFNGLIRKHIFVHINTYLRVTFQMS
jgi:hypothetical protein